MTGQRTSGGGIRRFRSSGSAPTSGAQAVGDLLLAGAPQVGAAPTISDQVGTFLPPDPQLLAPQQPADLDLEAALAGLGPLGSLGQVTSSGSFGAAAEAARRAELDRIQKIGGMRRPPNLGF